MVALAQLAGCHQVFGVDHVEQAAAWLPGLAARKVLTVAPPTDTTLTDVPIGVIVDDDELATTARTDGRDIIVTAADGTTRLDHELEHYAGGKLVAWVRVPRLAGTTRLYLYYGGDAASDAATTWSTRYGAVWHLAGAAPNIEPDSTGHGNALREGATTAQPAQTPGIAGFGRLFDGGDDRLTATHAASIDAGAGSLSVSLWVRVDDTLGGYDSPLGKGGTRDEIAGYVVQLGTDAWTGSVSDGVDQVQFPLGTSTLAGAWTHLAMVIDRDARQLRGYADGVALSPVALGALTSCASPTFDLALSPVYDPFRGAIDEVRIVREALPAAWFEVEAANLRDPSFLTLGPEQRPPDDAR